MFKSWVSSSKPSVIDLSEHVCSCPPEVLAPRSIPVEFRQGLHFEHPKLDLSGDEIYRLISKSKSGEDASIIQLIREYCQQFGGRSYTMEDLLSESYVVSGTCGLAASGFVNDLHELLRAVAHRYALLQVVDLDKALLKKILDGPTRVRTNRGNEKIWLNPVELTKGSFSVSLQEPLIALCIKPVRFLSYSKVDRARLRGILQEGISYLDLLERETEDGFKALLTAYKAAYRDWMGY